jgi:hypothetical protein
MENVRHNYSVKGRRQAKASAFSKIKTMLCVVVYMYNPGTWEVEAGRS